MILPNALHFLCGALFLFLILQSTEDPSCVAGEILESGKLLEKIKVAFLEDGVTPGDQAVKQVFTDEDKEYTCQLFFNLNEGSLLDGAILQKEEVTLEGFKKGEVSTTALIDF